MKKTILSRKLNNAVQCNVCSHRCKVSLGMRGICGVRENIDGVLYSLNYGKLISEALDPIEKKPFYHFLPGTQSLSIACAGCNFACGHCQNWDISQIKDHIKEDGENYRKAMPGRESKPEDIVKHAKELNIPSISYTYTEPTVFAEFALDVMKLAKKENLKNAWVTNGFMTKELSDLIIPHLDAANIDLKSFSESFYKKICKASLEPILENIVYLKKKNIWIELTTLIIPGHNDSEEELRKIAKFIKEKVGKDTPWHVSRFSPEISYKMKEIPPTPVEIVKKAVEIGKDAGLKNVYAGNL
ncbi:MAG: hypothetical protein ACD_63C00064G0006 [uncultured bacterium]|nr:MAG: hypothetical protein ACD_63C00064G0006 [uncultured bacterium]